MRRSKRAQGPSAEASVLYVPIGEVGSSLERLAGQVARGECQFIFTVNGHPLARLVPATGSGSLTPRDDTRPVAARPDEAHSRLVARLTDEPQLQQELRQALVEVREGAFVTLEQLDRLIGAD